MNTLGQLGGGGALCPLEKDCWYKEPDFATLDSHFLQVPQLLLNPKLLKGPMMMTEKNLRANFGGDSLQFFS